MFKQLSVDNFSCRIDVTMLTSQPGVTFFSGPETFVVGV